MTNKTPTKENDKVRKAKFFDNKTKKFITPKGNQSQQANRQKSGNTMSDTSAEDNKLLEVGCDRDLSSPVDIYIRLNDVTGLFKNRKRFKLNAEVRERIMYVIKKVLIPYKSRTSRSSYGTHELHELRRLE